jgi:hypothetical protein
VFTYGPPQSVAEVEESLKAFENGLKRATTRIDPRLGAELFEGGASSPQVPRSASPGPIPPSPAGLQRGSGVYPSFDREGAVTQLGARAFLEPRGPPPPAAAGPSSQQHPEEPGSESQHSSSASSSTTVPPPVLPDPTAPKEGARAKGEQRARPLAKRRGDIPAFWSCFAPVGSINIYWGTWWNLQKHHPGAKAARYNTREDADTWLWEKHSYDSADWEVILL